MLPQAFKEHVERQLAALRAELSRLSKGVDDTRAVVDTKAGLVEVRGHTVCLHHLVFQVCFIQSEHRLGYALWAHLSLKAMDGAMAVAGISSRSCMQLYWMAAPQR